MGRRGGVKTKVNKRIAHIKWLLFTKTPPPAWSTAQKLQSELDYLKASLLTFKHPITKAHSAIKSIDTKSNTNLNIPKPLPKRQDACPRDCPGPLESAHCKSTCMLPAAQPEEQQKQKTQKTQKKQQA